jgi:hypothetical protein
MRPKSTGMEQESAGIDPEFTGVEDFTAPQIPAGIWQN